MNHITRAALVSELARLTDAAHPLYVLVDGARGSGKTTLVDYLERQLPGTLRYKTFDRDPDRVPGLIQRGHLSIEQATVYALDTMSQVLGRGMVLMDRSPVSALACLEAIQLSQPTYDPSELERCRAVFHNEYCRLLDRLLDQGACVVHVLHDVTGAELRETWEERDAQGDTRPWAPVKFQRSLFRRVFACLPDAVTLYITHREDAP